MRLNPIPYKAYYSNLGVAYLSAGQVDKAIKALKHRIDHDPNAIDSLLPLIVCYVLKGDLDLARDIGKHVLEIDKKFSLAYHKEIMPIKDESSLNSYIDALRKAGLPY